ncbi:MAG: sigma-70 family RNA polymerase sigma factor [Planctomycetota bacterium]
MSETERDNTESLVDRLREGDEDALGPLFSVYRQHLHRMFHFRIDRRLRSRVDPSDVIQETYLDAAQRLRHFVAKPELSFLAWLRMVAGQRLIEVHRQHLGAQQRDARLEVSRRESTTPDATSVSIVRHLLGDLTSPSENAMRDELAERLQGILDSMDPMDREVIALRHFEELSNGEVADVLAIDKSAASKRYVRALRRLREIFAEIPGFEQAPRKPSEDSAGGEP